MNPRVETKRVEAQQDQAVSAELPDTGRIIQPLFAASGAELVPSVGRHMRQLESFLGAPTTTTAALALESCRALVEGIEGTDGPSVKSGRAHMLQSITLATLAQALTVEVAPENLSYLAHTLSGGGATGATKLDPALVAGISAYSDALALRRLKRIAARGGACDRCGADFIGLAHFIRNAPIQTGQVCKERTEQVRFVAELTQGFAKVLPKAREVLTHCSSRPALVASFAEHSERVEIILAAGKLGELSRLFPLLARDMVEAKYVIQKTIAEQDDTYEVDASFVNSRAGRKARSLVAA